MNILVCDDNKRDLQNAKHRIEQFGKEQYVELNIYMLCNVKTSQEVMTVADKHDLDVVFLDIDMPYISGEAIARELSDRYPLIKIIFYSNRDERIYDMLKYKPFRFIPKKDPEKINAAMMDLMQQMMIDGQFLIEKGKNETMKVSVEEIMFIEVVKHQLIFHMINEDIETRGSMAKCTRELWEYGFLRVHVAHLVNIRFIKRIDKKELYMENGTCIPIGSSYKEELMKNYKILLERIWYGQSV